jgi:hypothetical protein
VILQDKCCKEKATLWKNKSPSFQQRGIKSGIS